jgi:hypothetical protein
VNGKNALFDMIFIKCNCVSTRWQWSVNLFTDRKEIIWIRRNKTQNNTKKNRTHKTESYTRKQTANNNKNKTNNQNTTNSNSHKANNNDITHCTVKNIETTRLRMNNLKATLLVLREWDLNLMSLNREGCNRSTEQQL